MRGGPDEFEEAFALHFPRALRVASRLGLDPVAAEDVAAEALARAYAHWPKLRRCDYLEPWVVRVATNLAISALRKQARPAVEGSRPTPSAEEAVAAAVTLAAALQMLPRRQREAVVLCHLEGFTESEAAGVLRISANTVKTHVQRGMARLRDQLVGDLKECTTWPT